MDIIDTVNCRLSRLKHSNRQWIVFQVCVEIQVAIDIVFRDGVECCATLSGSCCDFVCLLLTNFSSPLCEECSVFKRCDRGNTRIVFISTRDGVKPDPIFIHRFDIGCIDIDIDKVKHLESEIVLID